MLFDYDITIPPGTLQLSPVEQIIKLTYGTVSEIRVFFPPGCATLAHVVVRKNLLQLLPANQQGSLNFDDIFVISRLEYDLIDSPFEMSIFGWSPSAVYQHIVTVQFEMIPLVGQSWSSFTQSVMELQNAG